MRRIVLVDHTKAHKPEPGVLQAIAEAITIQIERDFAPAWGVLPRQVTVGGSGDKVHVFDSAGQAEDFGWHYVDGKGLPYAHVFVAGSLSADSGWLTGEASVASTIGHEVLELLVDPCANEYAFDKTGLLWASEVCDPVQAHWYAIRAGGRQVPMTDFVLPAFFNWRSKGPYDHLGVLTKPFTLAKGGYAVCQEEGPSSERFGCRFTLRFREVPKARQVAKQADWGRTFWRQLALPS
jgi:hypothetical protein